MLIFGGVIVVSLVSVGSDVKYLDRQKYDTAFDRAHIVWGVAI